MANEVGVIYLYRFAEGVEPAQRFLEFYRGHSAGVPHDFHVILKGFPDKANLDAARVLFEKLMPNFFELSDEGYDVGSYLIVARQVENQRLVFLNTFSRILANEWLAILDRALTTPAVGLVGVTGSWLSNTSWMLASLRRGGWRKAVRKFVANRVPEYPAISGQPKPVTKLRRLVAISRTFANLCFYPPFPNAHIRTNAFMISRNVLLGLKIPHIRDKTDVYRFESGRDSMTRQIAKAGFQTLLVGRDGNTFVPGAWNLSSTFWQGDQGNLLIADNQTEDYANGDSERRRRLQSLAWQRARPDDGAESLSNSDPAAGIRTDSPRLLFVVTEDWYFLLHRLPMALAAQDAGFDVHVATRISQGGDAIRRKGIAVHPVPFTRGRISPLASLRTISALRRIHRRLNPSVTHHVSMQTIVLGSLAAMGRPTALVNAFTGLGSVFVTNNFRTRLLRRLLGVLLRIPFNQRDTVILVENPDDKNCLAELGVEFHRIVAIPGSGVDVKRLRPSPEPAGPPTIAFAGRLIEIKGIRTLIEAQRLLRHRGSNVELLVAGTPDPANPTSISAEEAATWGCEPGVHWLGHVEDIATLWARASIAVLPSRGGEGVPMSLLEAAAAGRPMVASDVPGCREIVIPGKTGLLVPVNDALALANAIEVMAGSRELRRQYGEAARSLAVERFATDNVSRQIALIYRSLANRTARQPSSERCDSH